MVSSRIDKIGMGNYMASLMISCQIFTDPKDQHLPIPITSLLLVLVGDTGDTGDTRETENTGLTGLREHPFNLLDPTFGHCPFGGGRV